MWLVIGGKSEIGAAVRRHFRECREPALATTRRQNLAGAERPYLDIASSLEQWVPPAGTPWRLYCRSRCSALGVRGRSSRIRFDQRPFHVTPN